MKHWGQMRAAGRGLTRAVTLTLVILAFVAGNVTGFSARAVLAQRDIPAEFAVFWEAWDLVVEYFVDRERVEFTAMTYGAIQGMLATLGDENHTAFFSPEEGERQSSALEGSFEGIGAYVEVVDEQFVIVAPMRGSPAEAAGIQPGDIVLAVDGVEITGMAQWEAIGLIRGPSGSAVALTILHPGEETPVQITVIRGRINLESVLWASIPETDLAYIQITQFTADTSRELSDALRAILETDDDTRPPTTGLILDLRNNPGGYVQEALRVASQFLPEGDIILHEQDASGRTMTYRSEGRGLARALPLVVLINRGSASAAEILSGAIQENERGKLVGMPTVGTGTVLRPFMLSDGSLLRLGVTNWLTPNYELIKGEGIQPDTQVEQEGSVELISAVELGAMEPAEMRLHPDRQFQTALLTLRMHLDPALQQPINPPPRVPRGGGN